MQSVHSLHRNSETEHNKYILHMDEETEQLNNRKKPILLENEVH